MKDNGQTWLQSILESNREFRARLDTDSHPPARQACPYAVITCMDPRVNLEAVGIPPFTEQGLARSQVRIIRTIGAMSDFRSLVIGIHLAGIREIAFVMHTDCGCSLALSKIDKIIENLRISLDEARFSKFRNSMGEPFREKLIAWLKAFEDPAEAVKKEIVALKEQPFIPRSLILHGLVYDLAGGGIEVVVNGYDV